ncbi:siderophore ABC transporter permease [Methylopila jiangsuensis]|uniref:Siderophore ABC transporter permease n=1 Tax=Methylopila jiangsuensis TaxID=586230 RepID=A0A9W6JHF4_9HYPH|nr:iron ABC transporter permease [Methylopila jiangsuensis]MDR6284911.1 iron complex transport system permease protein [Methylopila jiangsuensis]GLK77701.1 siderophore ABC transporter permease [Methylopila jiangsuensis]
MSGRAGFRAGGARRAAALVALAGLLAAVGFWSLSAGSTPYALGTVLDALIANDGSRDHLVIATIRAPRLLAGLGVGAALAVAGAIMQAVTGNPLASPGLMGLNAGAAFAVVLATAVAGASTGDAVVWPAFGGAAAAAVVVYGLGATGRGGATPLKIVLAGAVVSGFLGSLTAAVLVLDKGAMDTVRLWTAGSLAGRTAEQVQTVGPYILAGLAVSLLLGRALNALSLGADAARALGQNVRFWRRASIVTVVLLAGGAVALAGPIGFVGLVTPHIVRMLAGADHRWAIPFCALGGALLLTAADAASRTLLGSGFPAGVTMALIGAPFFIHLARRRIGAAP